MKTPVPQIIKQILSLQAKDLKEKPNEELLHKFYLSNAYCSVSHIAQMEYKSVRPNQKYTNNIKISFVNALKKHFINELNIYDLQVLIDYQVLMKSMNLCEHLEIIKKSIIFDAFINQDPHKIITPELYDLVDNQFITELYSIDLAGWLLCLNQLPRDLQNIAQNNDTFNEQHNNTICHIIDTSIRANKIDTLKM